MMDHRLENIKSVIIATYAYGKVHPIKIINITKSLNNEGEQFHQYKPLPLTSSNYVIIPRRNKDTQ